MLYTEAWVNTSRHPNFHCVVLPQGGGGGLAQGLGQAPTAAACRSMPQRQILGAVGGGFEACRSMPQRAKIFTWWTFFFITCQTCEPFVAQMSQNWMVLSGLCTRFQLGGSQLPFLERAFFCLSVPLYCCTDFRFFGVVLTCQVLRILKLPRHHRFLKPVPLSENDGTLDQQLEACRSMPQHAAACRSEPKFSWGPLVLGLGGWLC